MIRSAVPDRPEERLIGDDPGSASALGVLRGAPEELGGWRQAARQREIRRDVATGRSDEWWGSRLSRRCVGRPGSRGSGREQQGSLARDCDVGRQLDLGRKDEQATVRTAGHGNRKLGMTMVTGVPRPFDRGNQFIGSCGRGFRGSVMVMVIVLVRRVLLRLMMRVPVRQAHSGSRQAHERGQKQPGKARQDGATHQGNVPAGGKPGSPRAEWTGMFMRECIERAP